MYDVDLIPNALIDCDGDELAADLYRPRDAPPAPALVTVLPYHKDGLGGVQFRSSGEYFASHGYPSLLVDLRGTGGSSGELRPAFDPSETDDGVAAVEWAARQDWCNGRVGMWGMSYGGIMALRTACRRPPALKAIVSMMGQVDPGRDFVHPQGARGMRMPYTWALLMLSLQLTPPLYFDDRRRWHEVWRQRLESAEPQIIDFARRAPDDPIWSQRAIDVEAIDVPTLCVTGWRDFLADAMIEAFERIRAPKRLLAGPWGHAMPHEAPNHAIDFLGTMVQWWDRWLRDVPNDVEASPEATIFALGRERWSTFDRWPGSSPPAAELPLSADGVLGGDVRGTVATSVDATVGLDAHVAMNDAATGAANDEHADDTRSLAFTTQPLRHPLEPLGRPRLHVTLDEPPECELPLVARLADVDAYGRAVPITVGVARVGPDDDAVEIALAPTDYEVAAGHRLRLSLGTADFPRLWPATLDQPVRVVCAPGDSGSGLVLPLAPDDGRRRWEPAPFEPVLPPEDMDAGANAYTIARRRGAGARATDSVSFSTETTTDMSSRHGGAHTLTRQTTIAAVDARDRGSESWRGESRSTIDTEEGSIEIEASIAATHDRLVATGKVTWNGQVVFERCWERPPGAPARTPADDDDLVTGGRDARG